MFALNQERRIQRKAEQAKIISRLVEMTIGELIEQSQLSRECHSEAAEELRSRVPKGYKIPIFFRHPAGITWSKEEVICQLAVKIDAGKGGVTINWSDGGNALDQSLVYPNCEFDILAAWEKANAYSSQIKSAMHISDVFPPQQ